MKMKTLHVLLLVSLFLSMNALGGQDVYLVLNNHLNTPVKVIEVNALNDANTVWEANYSPFGEVEETVSDIEFNVRFPGQYHDQETGVYYNYYRDYDPNLGRYLQSDPIGILRDYSSPQMRVAMQAGIPLRSSSISLGLNHTYNYVNNSPINFFDLFGLEDAANQSGIDPVHDRESWRDGDRIYPQNGYWRIRCRNGEDVNTYCDSNQNSEDYMLDNTTPSAFCTFEYVSNE